MARPSLELAIWLGAAGVAGSVFAAGGAAPWLSAFTTFLIGAALVGRRLQGL